MTSTLISRSFWLTDLDCISPLGQTNLPAVSDAVVIGGGLTGVSTAYWLSRLGVGVTLLDRSHLASGATGRNGGHVVFGPNQNFATSVQAIGLEPSLELWDFTKTSVKHMGQLVADHGIDCDLYFTPWVTLALTAEQAERLRTSYELMVPYGLATDFWQGEKLQQALRSDRFMAGLVEPLHAQMWPAKLVFGMSQVATEQGAVVCPNTSVQSVHRQGQQLTVATNQGEIRTKAVVYATNGFTHHLLPELKSVVVPVRGQVLGTEPLPRLWEFDWLANDGYEYAIQRQDGRIILGGMRRQSPTHEVGIEDHDTLEPNVSQGLRQFLREAFESLQDIRIDYEWTGIMAYTPDENPLVGPLPHRPGEYIAAGYTGHGMSLGFWAGKALAERIAGVAATPLPQAFDPRRFWPI
jgi:glycine/D-amino acid oxidase-like deaminating enzyme